MLPDGAAGGERADQLAQPLEELKAFHDKHRGVGTVMGVKVRSWGTGREAGANDNAQVDAEIANKFGCIVTDPLTFQVSFFRCSLGEEGANL